MADSSLHEDKSTLNRTADADKMFFAALQIRLLNPGLLIALLSPSQSTSVHRTTSSLARPPSPPSYH